MKISKKDALNWFRFFAQLPPGEDLLVKQQEIVYATLAQIERAEEKRQEELFKKLKAPKNLMGRTWYVGSDERFPKGCRSCLTGTGLSAVRKTHTCNIQCRFCYYYGEIDNTPPIGEGMWEIGGTKFYEKDVDLLFSIQKKPTGISYVYLEPFMEIEEYYSFIRKFADAGIYQHMYTNGTLANEENLKALGEAGLNELRFNLGATNCADYVIENMKIAKKYIPMVGIETPMTPEFFETFMKKKEKIIDTGFDFINCAELHLNPNNIDNYMGENIYVTRHGYVSPIWSRELTLKFMKEVEDQNMPFTAHDCSNMTKFTRDLNLRSQEDSWFGASTYSSEFPEMPYEAFLPILEDESFQFLEEEPLPKGYNVGELY